MSRGEHTNSEFKKLLARILDSEKGLSPPPTEPLPLPGWKSWAFMTYVLGAGVPGLCQSHGPLSRKCSLAPLTISPTILGASVYLSVAHPGCPELLELLAPA